MTHPGNLTPVTQPTVGADFAGVYTAYPLGRPPGLPGIQRPLAFQSEDTRLVGGFAASASGALCSCCAISLVSQSISKRLPGILEYNKCFLWYTGGQQVNYASESIIKSLRARRKGQGLTLRGLAQKVGSTHSHIARIESGTTDPKLSTVIELARTLELEVMLIPRQLVPVVQSLVRGAAKRKEEDEEESTPRAAYALTEDEDEDE